MHMPPETFLDVVREVAKRLKCPNDYNDDDTLDLMSHRYEAFTVLWTVTKDSEMMIILNRMWHTQLIREARNGNV